MPSTRAGRLSINGAAGTRSIGLPCRNAPTRSSGLILSLGMSIVIPPVRCRTTLLSPALAAARGGVSVPTHDGASRGTAWGAVSRGGNKAPLGRGCLHLAQLGDQFDRLAQGVGGVVGGAIGAVGFHRLLRDGRAADHDLHE